MKTFAEYYKDLLEWEGVEFQELISVWELDLITQIQNDSRQAIENSALKTLLCPILENSTNQSIGNQIEVYAIEQLNKTLQIFIIENCSGAGYPDRILAKDDFRQIALEMKATSNWNPNDSNR